MLCKQGVTGSIPVTSTIFFLIAKDLKKSRWPEHVSEHNFPSWLSIKRLPIGNRCRELSITPTKVFSTLAERTSKDSARTRCYPA